LGRALVLVAIQDGFDVPEQLELRRRDAIGGSRDRRGDRPPPGLRTIPARLGDEAVERLGGIGGLLNRVERADARVIRSSFSPRARR
jgi:hypothetical protein